MGGVGKTQTALEYTYRFRADFQCIFWLPSEDVIVLSRAYCEIGKRVGLFQPGQAFGQPEIDVVLDWLRTTGESENGKLACRR